MASGDFQCADKNRRLEFNLLGRPASVPISLVGDKCDGRAVLRTLIITLTRFGDVAVLMPLAIIVLIWLLLIRSFRCAAWWTMSVLLCLIATVFLKLSFDQCPPIPQVHSPSGHTSLSTLVYGAITFVATAQTNGWLKRVMFGGGASLIVGIAASRLYLNAHSLSEVGLGFVVGAATLVVFGLSYRQFEGATIARVILLIFLTGTLTIILHGRSLNTAVMLQKIASYFSIYCA